MARVVSPNSSGSQPKRPHPDLSTERGDPRRPYYDNKPPEARQDKGFVNTMMGGAGGMDRDSARKDDARTDDTRKYARDEVERHLREHRHGWQR
jgi:hypothetical protein